MDSSNRIPLNTARIVALSLVLCTTAPAQPGTPVWTNRYNGPGNSTDVATAIRADGNGNVFVTGYSRSTASAGSEDFATIKYSSAGLPLWTNRYNGPGNSGDRPRALAVDPSGNVVVAGFSTGSGTAEDFTVIKYSGAGVAAWTNRYNGSANSTDVANAVAVDGNGDVCVTGYSFESVSASDFITIKYSASGAPLWTNRYNGPAFANSGDLAVALAVDASNNVLVTGYSSDGNTFFDYATIKYSDAGVPLWTNRYGGPGNGDDRAAAIAVGTNGSVIVTGTSSGSFFQGDFTTVAYSSAGVPLWTNRFNGPGNFGDQAWSVTADPAGNVAVAGAATGAGGNTDFAVLKYSATGTPLWTNYYNGPGNAGDEARAVLTDSGGNVIVTGFARTGGLGTEDCTTIAYSSAGLPLWTNRYNGPGNNTDQATAISADAAGNIVVTGSATGSGSSEDFLTLKYNGFSNDSGPSAMPLYVQQIGSQVVLTWSNATFNLQSAPVVTGMFTNVTGATSPHTNLATGGQRYFRLMGN